MRRHELRYASTAELKARVRAAWRPPPRLRVSDFADDVLIVPTGPHEGSKWDMDFMPYQRGVVDAFSEPGVDHVVFKASSQVGKTSTALVLVGYHIAHDPSPILVVQPTLRPMAEDFSKNRLDPIIHASPILDEAVAKKREKDSSNTTFLKTYRGGFVAIGGANSAASLASRSIRFLLLDEVDRYPKQLRGEGNTIQIALKRTTAYGSRRRIFISSSPTFKGAAIDTWHARGDQRKYFIPCPACDHFHVLEWKNVIWDDDDPLTARLHCPACDHAITNAERVAALQRGEWRPTKPDRAEKNIVSFHIWEAYSPLSSISEIVREFLAGVAAKKEGDDSVLHTFFNTALGEAVEPYVGEQLDSSVLLLRKENYFPAGSSATVPEGAVFLTRAVDTQDDRLEELVIGWGPGEESWIVDRHILDGDTSQPTNDPSVATPWRALDELLSLTYEHASGARLHVSATMIDSGGHRTERVYEYVHPRRAHGVYAIIGRAGERPIASSPRLLRWGRNRKRKIQLYTVGVDAAKALIMGRLALEERGPGFVHIPNQDWADHEFALQLTSERLISRMHRGIMVREWQQTRARNEALDLFVYNVAGLRLIHPDLKLLKQRLAGEEPPPQAPPPTPRSGFLGARREGWLNRSR